MKALPRKDHHYNIDPIGDLFRPTAPLAELRPQRTSSAIGDTNGPDKSVHQFVARTDIAGEVVVAAVDVKLLTELLPKTHTVSWHDLDKTVADGWLQPTCRTQK